MPSTKHQSTSDKPTLKQRAAALGASAARVIQRKPAERPDPIFAAIAAHRAAWDANEASLEREGHDAAVQAAFSAAYHRLCNTRPISIDGYRALLNHLAWRLRQEGHRPFSNSTIAETAFDMLLAAAPALDPAEARTITHLPPVADLLTPQLAKEWAAYRALPTDKTPEAYAARDRGYDRIDAIVKAIERLPAIPTSLNAKALALAWIDSSETLFGDQPRHSYATDGKLGFDIQQIVIAQAQPEPERAAFAGLIEPRIATAGLDLTGQPGKVLSALHDIARTADKIGDAFICRPECEEGKGQHGDIIYNAAGEFADWLTAVSGFVMERVELEAQRRAPDPVDDDDRLCITAKRAIENGDRDELHALIRDLQAKARRDARG